MSLALPTWSRCDMRESEVVDFMVRAEADLRQLGSLFRVLVTSMTYAVDGGSGSPLSGDSFKQNKRPAHRRIGPESPGGETGECRPWVERSDSREPDMLVFLDFLPG
jgi:hypothetical protein